MTMSQFILDLRFLQPLDIFITSVVLFFKINLYFETTIYLRPQYPMRRKKTEIQSVCSQCILIMYKTVKTVKSMFYDHRLLWSLLLIIRQSKIG